MSHEVTWLEHRADVIVCERCGIKTPLPLPMPVHKLVVYLRGITYAHRLCEVRT